MKRHSLSSQKGFTLIELLVVIAIIVIMLSIVLFAISEARKSTRDKKRISDLKQINFALELYRNEHKRYPSADSGVVIGTGGAIDALIKQSMGNVYKDVLSTGNSSSLYDYVLDTRFRCTDDNQVVLFARSMEQTKNVNFSDVCTHASPDSPGTGANPHIFILQ